MFYVLFGKIQTDGLEDRFGKYRQLAGSQYHVSIRQIYEGENKMRLQSTLPTVSKLSHHESHRDEQWEDLDQDEGAARANYNVVVTQDTLSKITDVIPVLVYVAGYCVYSTLRRLKCEKCRDVLTIDKEVTVSVEDPKYELVKELDRGGLVHPSTFAVNAIAHSYAVVEELSRRDDLTILNQHQVATDLTVDLLTEDESSDFDGCDAGHTKEIVLKYILWCSSNILLKNFCSRMNDDIRDASEK